MSPDDLLMYTRRRPFEPFRIWVSNGEYYDIRHPELCIAGYTSTVIGLPRDPNKPAAERYEMVSMMHIVKIEPLAPAETAKK